MRCSRLAFQLGLLALTGTLVLLGPSGGRNGVAAEIGPEAPPYARDGYSESDWYYSGRWYDEYHGYPVHDAYGYEYEAERQVEPQVNAQTKSFTESGHSYPYDCDYDYEYDYWQDKYTSIEGPTHEQILEANDVNSAETDESDVTATKPQTHSAAQENSPNAPYDYDYTGGYDYYNYGNYGYDYYMSGQNPYDEHADSPVTTTKPVTTAKPVTVSEKVTETVSEQKDNLSDARGDYGDYGRYEYDAYVDGNDDYNYNYGEGHGKYADDYSYRDESDYDRYYSEYDYNYQDGNEVDTYEVMDVESDDLGNSVVEMPYADDLDPFAWMPSDLLQPADKDLLRTLNALFEEPGSTRATLLNEYFEDLGLDAAEFVARFEEAFGNRALHLHDDLPGVAAVLATYRMVEQGELGMDAGVEALQRQFNGLSPEWIEDVSFIVTELPDDRGVRAEHAPRNERGRVLQAILAVSTRSIQDAGLGLSAFFGDLTTLPGRVLTIGDAVRLTQFGTAALRNWTAR